MSNPCNPCNPCGKDAKPIRNNRATSYNDLVAKGKALWNDESLGGSGISCMTCHADYELLNLDKHNGVWPHPVAMTKDILTFDQMINFCMMNPMETKPLPRNSIEMTAIAAYYQEYIKSFKPGNPCGMKMKHPCNPCGMKMKHPCNPCGMKMKNPCNPCGR